MTKMQTTTGRELNPSEVEAIVARVLQNPDVYVYVWRRDGSPIPSTVAAS